MSLRACLCFPALLLAGCVPGVDCSHTASREVAIDAAGLQRLTVAARAGDLDIRGEPGLTQAIASGRACAGDAETLARVQLRDSRSGDHATLAVEIPDGSGWGWRSSPTMDLIVRVPVSVALEVSDSSGDATIRDVASATVQDSSGDLTISGVAGDLRVTDSSGDIDIRDVGGTVHVPSDSSGDIGIVKVEGDVRIEQDSSGDVEVRQVRGDATVENDSSGDIVFETIGGSARVGRDSSGSIRARDVGRDFIVERDGSGDIRHEDVRGTVRVPRE